MLEKSKRRTTEALRPTKVDASNRMPKKKCAQQEAWNRMQSSRVSHWPDYA